MFLSIYHNQTGEEYIRRLGPNEWLDLRALVQRWFDQEIAGELDTPCKLSWSEPGSYIPNGCGEYQAELRDTKRNHVDSRVWTSEAFYIVCEESDS